MIWMTVPLEEQAWMNLSKARTESTLKLRYSFWNKYAKIDTPFVSFSSARLELCSLSKSLINVISDVSNDVDSSDCCSNFTNNGNNIYTLSASLTCLMWPVCQHCSRWCHACQRCEWWQCCRSWSWWESVPVCGEWAALSLFDSADTDSSWCTHYPHTPTACYHGYNT